ncbi:MAG TPA: carboxypeptidase-like regulatory domain-containing protein, partial [Pyrinomonadaceae bacterium]|nr:carboxypeptidase-like regulatory domain-containing protein [Pyrinomonadaceae bacterium]
MKSSLPRLHAVGLGLALLFAFAVNATAQSQPDESPAPSTGAITGQVVTDTGQPVAGATVIVRAYGPTGQNRVATTDTEGNFQVSGLDQGSYTVVAQVSAFVTPPRDPDNTQPSFHRVGDTVKLQLVKGGVITGSVTSSADEGIVGVKVRAYMIRDSAGRATRYGINPREKTTDDRGIYRIYGLPAGTYVVSAGGGGSFSGFNINPYDLDAPTYSPSSTRDTATEVSVSPGAEASNIDIHYRGEPGHAVSGMAVSPVGAGPSTFTIYLSPISNGVSQWSHSTFQPPGNQGFSFYGVADGDYDVVAQTYFPGGEFALSTPRRLKVNGADITGLELTATPLASISGRVALEESKAPECQGKRRPLFAETLITPWHNEKAAAKDQPQLPWSLGTPTFPDKQGEFVMRNLASGQYRFNTRPLVKYWYLQSISWRSAATPPRGTPAIKPVDAARNWISLKSGERASGLTITLAAGAASLKGKIKLAEGEKLPPRLFVSLVPAEPEKAEDVLRYFVALVDADGGFALNNLPPGRYFTIAKPAADNESNLLSKLRLP